MCPEAGKGLGPAVGPRVQGAADGLRPGDGEGPQELTPHRRPGQHPAPSAVVGSTPAPRAPWL